MYDNSTIEPNNNKRGYSLLIEHKERYDIITGEERYNFVLQQVPRDVLPCQYVSAN